MEPIMKQFVQPINSPISAGNNHYGIIDENGNLSMVGKNNHGQLGDGSFTLSRVPVPIRFPSKVVSISCGWDFTGVVTEEGKAYLWGWTGWSTWMLDTQEIVNKPRWLDHLKDKFAVKISINPTDSNGYGVIFRDGSAYVKMTAMDEFERTVVINQTLTISPGIIDLKMNHQSIYILTKDGKIYTSGLPDFPRSSKHVQKMNIREIRLGFKKAIRPFILDPFLITFKKTVQQISLGGRAGMTIDDPNIKYYLRSFEGLNVLTTEGELFTLNSYGDNGPDAVRMLDAWGDENELDLETALRESKPQKILIPGKIAHISNLGGTAAVITEDRKLYMWGINTEDRIIAKGTVVSGVGGYNLREKEIPKPIQLKIGSKVRYVSIGGEFTIAVTEDGLVNYWGTDDLKPRAEIKPNWYKNCANTESYVTLEDWKDNPVIDYIQIYDKDTLGQVTKKPVCYDREGMIKMMETQVFADWVPSPYYDSPGQFTMSAVIDDNGHGGEPGKKRYYKTILYYVDQASYYLLKDLTIREYIKEPQLLNQRIGNLRGQFGVGQHHGQLPGFTIYSLRAKPQ